MRVVLDETYLKRVIQNRPEYLKKILSVPPVDCIAELCTKAHRFSEESLINHLPEGWLSDELFFKLINTIENKYWVVKLFVELGKLPKLTTEQKIKIFQGGRIAAQSIRFFPELPYNVWLDYTDGIDNSNLVPVAYQTQELLLNLMGNNAEIAPDLMTDELIDAYIEVNGALTHVPTERITLERLKRVLIKNPATYYDKKDMNGIEVDEELADLMTGHTYNFELIPDQYRTRERLIAFLVGEVKRKENKPSFWNIQIPQFLKRKGWLNDKFYMEVLEKTGDRGVLVIKAIHYELKEEKSTFNMTDLVKLYPAAIKYVIKTDQTKAMAEAVLASDRANDLKDFLSLKFITKKTSPLFLSSENKDVVEKVERVLSGQPKKPVYVYTIEPGREVELELSDEDLQDLRDKDVPFIV